MAVSLNSHWKIPLGYFFINSLTGEEKASIVTKCLTMLHAEKIKCHSLTFFGAASNITICNILGCNFNLKKLDPWFLHPVTKGKIFVFFDAVHMIKLVRNALGTKKTI